ncbi:MAG: endolytic transglycosylase MltG [Bacteroidaceae bacterium]|nr:endolytic transglycosylase MltG [Bacteroidaceae bacterium]
MKTEMKKILLSLLSVAVLFILGYGIIVAYSLLGEQFNNKETDYLYIYPADNVKTLKQKITSVASPSSMAGFDLAARTLDISGKMKAGRYEVRPSMNMLTLLRNIRNHVQTPVNLIVPSVRTVQTMAGKLSERLMVDSAALASLLTDSAACANLGYTRETVPALFIPNTYQVYWDITAGQLLERMQKENAAFWNEQRQAKARQIGMSREEIVTLASIVDSETTNNAEKPRIAGLYLNRLKANMLLQSDPTVIFAVGDFTIRRVLRKHLDVDSPYNTYKYKGLPPGPIRIPSVVGIDAVLNHETHNYLYMCAKEDFSGTHNFAATYAEHQQNARRYIRALDKKGIK